MKLAAQLGRVSILSLLLAQQVLFQISRDDMLTMAKDLLARKPDGWRAAYRLLVDDWKRKQQQRRGRYYEVDLWAKKLEMYSG